MGDKSKEFTNTLSKAMPSAIALRDRRGQEGAARLWRYTESDRGVRSELTLRRVLAGQSFLG